MGRNEKSVCERMTGNQNIRTLIQFGFEETTGEKRLFLKDGRHLLHTVWI